MSFEAADLDRLLAPAYLEGLQGLPLDEVRAKRSECQEVEVKLSFVRRVAQGRLDIVHAELERRSGEQSADLSGLVDDLAAILSEKVHAPGAGRLPLLLAPDLESEDLTAELDEVAGVKRLGSLDSSSDYEVRRTADALVQVETSISAKRRALHGIIDRIQEEIVSRYKSGRASVDNLLP